MLGEKSSDVNEFKKNLAENGAEFPVSIHYNLLSFSNTASTVSIKTLRRKTIAMFPRQPSQSVMRMLSYDWVNLLCMRHWTCDSYTNPANDGSMDIDLLLFP